MEALWRSREASWTTLAIAMLWMTSACTSAPSANDTVDGIVSSQVEWTDADRAIHLESYDEVWRTVRDQHYDENLNGVDWDAAGRRHRERVESANSVSEVRSAMRALLAELGQSHFGIIPASVYEDAAPPASGSTSSEAGDEATENASESLAATASSEAGETESGGHGETAAPGGPGDSGISVRALDGRVIVTDVWRDWPAWEAGVRPGFELVTIGDWDVAGALRAIESSEDGAPVLFYGIVEGRLNRELGEVVRIGCRDAAGDTIDLDVPIGPRRGEAVQFGNMPDVPVWTEVRRVGETDDGYVGYVAFNIFLNPMKLIPAIQGAVTEFSDADGMILDLRGNPGGVGALAMGIAGWFVNETKLKLGTMKSRNAEFSFVVNPRPPYFDRPVAVLIDEASASTSEILAGGMKDLGVARVFGTTSAGMALPSYISELPNGDRFQYATANYISEGGDVLEGNGVVPDEPVRLTRESLLEGRDLVIESAVEWIRSSAPRAID